MSAAKRLLNKRTYLFIAILSGLILSVTVSAAPKTQLAPLHWGYVDFPPFTYSGKQNDVDGFIADMAKQLLHEINQPYRSFHYPNRRLFAHIADGTIDFGLFTRSVVRDADHFLISRLPLSTTELRVYWLGDKTPVKAPEDLHNQRVILISGFSYGTLRRYVTNPEHRVKIVANVEDHSRAFDLLRLGRGDYLLSYKGPSDLALKDSPLEGLRHQVLDALDIYLVLNANLPNAKALMAQLEAAQQKLFPVKASLDEY